VSPGSVVSFEVNKIGFIVTAIMIFPPSLWCMRS